MSRFSRFNPPTKYVQVMNDLVRRIDQDEWKVGESLPSVAVLAEKYRFNRLTILKALGHLAQHGYVEIERGRRAVLKEKSTKPMIGVIFRGNIFTEPGWGYRPLLARTVERHFAQSGYETKLYLEHRLPQPQGIPNRDLVRDLEIGALDGLISVDFAFPFDSVLQSAFWKKHRVPYVIIGFPSQGCHSVFYDFPGMVDLGLDVLRQRGCREVAVIGWGGDSSELIAKAADRGLATRPEWLPSRGTCPSASGYRDMHAIWKGESKPDGLLITDDVTGIGVFQALLELRVRVPEDLAVICHANKDSGLFCPMDVPQLEFDPGEVIQAVGDLLFKQMDDPFHPPETIWIAARLRLEQAVQKEEVGNSVAAARESPPCQGGEEAGVGLKGGFHG